MSEFAKPLGGLLIGAFLNTHVFGLVSYQFGVYHNTRYEDDLWLKLVVAALLCLDLFHSSEIIYMIWLYCVTNYARPDLIAETLWPFTFTPLVTSCSALLAHLFLTHCAFSATRCKPVCVALVALSVIDFGVGIGYGVKSIEVSWLSEISANRLFHGAWLIIDVLINAVICAVLVYSFVQGRGLSKHHDDRQFTWWRLVKLAMQKGVFNLVTSLITLIVFATTPRSSLYAIFALPMGRIYTNSVLTELTSRSGIQTVQEMIYTSNAIQFAKYADAMRRSQSLRQGISGPAIHDYSVKEQDGVESPRPSQDGKFDLREDVAHDDAIQQVKRDA